jgi:hypothetical protein
MQIHESILTLTVNKICFALIVPSHPDLALLKHMDGTKNEYENIYFLSNWLHFFLPFL